MELEFTIDDKKVVRVLDTAGRALKTYKAPLTDISKDLLKTIDLNFDSRGSLYGGWAPRTKAYPWPLLENTGTMRDNFDKEVTDKQASIFNLTDYFVYHQSSAPRTTNLPRRVMMSLRRQDARMITKTFQSYIADALQGRTDVFRRF